MPKTPVVIVALISTPVALFLVVFAIFTWLHRATSDGVFDPAYLLAPTAALLGVTGILALIVTGMAEE